MKYCKCKKIEAIVKAMVQQGWSFKWGRKHGQLGHPAGGPKITVPKTPSDWRASRNFQRDLRHLADMMKQPR